jgi:hypothetical protein
MSERVFGTPLLPDDETNEPEGVIGDGRRRPGLGPVEEFDDDENKDETQR